MKLHFFFKGRDMCVAIKDVLLVSKQEQWTMHMDYASSIRLAAPSILLLCLV